MVGAIHKDFTQDSMVLHSNGWGKKQSVEVGQGRGQNQTTSVAQGFALQGVCVVDTCLNCIPIYRSAGGWTSALARR